MARVAAIAIEVAGSLFHVLALGALAVVQPILVCNLVVAVAVTVVSQRL